LDIQLGFTSGIRNLIDSDNGNVDHVRDICSASLIEQAPRALNVNLPVFVVPSSSSVDNRIDTLNSFSHSCARFTIGLLPFGPQPIITVVSPSAHPAHGITCRSQLLHNLTAQRSCAASHQNMLHNLFLTYLLSSYLPLVEVQTGDEIEWGKCDTMIRLC